MIEDEGRARFRRGDTALARFFRKKDELLNWKNGQILSLAKDRPDVHNELVSKYFLPINTYWNRLEENSGDEESLLKVTELMESLSRRAGEISIKDYPDLSEERLKKMTDMETTETEG